MMTFASNNVGWSLGGQFAVALLILAAAVAIGFFLNRLSRYSRKRAACLAASELITNDFYDRAKTLLADPNTPRPLKSMILDISLAVTYGNIGKRALDSIIVSIQDMSRTGRSPNPGEDFLRQVQNLRQEHGDLYDLFGEAMGAALLSLLLSHGLDHDKVVIKVINNKDTLFAFAEKMDRAIGEKVGRDMRDWAVA